MAVVYIIYSKSIDRYYIGSCLNVEKRLMEHQNNHYNAGFTHRAEDWNLFLKIEDLDYTQARKIETHIKKMKSRTYIGNLKKYPDIIRKLKMKYE